MNCTENYFQYSFGVFTSFCNLKGNFQYTLRINKLKTSNCNGLFQPRQYHYSLQIYFYPFTVSECYYIKCE